MDREREGRSGKEFCMNKEGKKRTNKAYCAVRVDESYPIIPLLTDFIVDSDRHYDMRMCVCMYV